MAYRCAYLLVAISVVRTVHAVESAFNYYGDLTDAQKQDFVDSHNHFRRMVDPEASNMRFMTWDNELEEFARNFVRKCSFAHTPNDQLKTSAFSWIGENLYTGGSVYFSDISTKVGVTKLWFDEIDFYDFATSTCEDDKQCGHYTQVSWATSFKVGCAVSYCDYIDSGGTAPTLVACHYGPGGNFVQYGTLVRPYKNGTACSECGEEDMCMDSLCNNTARDVTPTTVGPTTMLVTTPIAKTTAEISTSTEAATQGRYDTTTGSPSPSECSVCGTADAVYDCLIFADGSVTCFCIHGYELDSTTYKCHESGARRPGSDGILKLTVTLVTCLYCIVQ